VTFPGMGPLATTARGLLRRVDGLDPIVSPTAACTRVILTVRSEASEPTAFFDPNPAITPVEATDLLHRVEGALAVGGVEAITLSGSSPSTSTHEVFSELIALARARRIPAFLDTYGPALDAIWGFWPESIGLNRREAGLHLDNPDPSDADLIAFAPGAGRATASRLPWSPPARTLCSRSLTAGPYRAIPPTIQAVNPVGSGDCLLAGLVDARLKGFDPESTLKHALAAQSPTPASGGGGNRAGVGCQVHRAVTGRAALSLARKAITEQNRDPLLSRSIDLTVLSDDHSQALPAPGLAETIRCGSGTASARTRERPRLLGQPLHDA